MDVRGLGKTGYQFTNWSETVTCLPEFYFEPNTDDEIRNILARAREKGRKVKVVGGGYSVTALACTNDYMISLSKYNKVLEVDKTLNTIKVQGGAMIADLVDTTLPEIGLAFSVLPIIRDVSVAGCISTGTHGTGELYGNVSSYVTGMDIMTYNGEIVKVTEEENADLLPAARVSLGTLGVILNVTIQCEPAFKLHLRLYPANLKDVLENINVHSSSSDHFAFSWYPHTEEVTCLHYNRTDKENHVHFHWFWDVVMGRYILLFLLYLSTFIPSLVPHINRWYSTVNRRTVDIVERSDRVFYLPVLSHAVTEWFVPRHKFAAVFIEMKTWIEQNNFPASFPIHCRTVKADDSFLSPVFGDGTFCTIQILSWRIAGRCIAYQSYFDELKTIMMKAGGRPHWAKEHGCTYKDLEKLYPKWGEFQKVRKSLDPSGMFINDHLEHILGK